jgi:nucleoside-diphosphate-sugar epimerase
VKAFVTGGTGFLGTHLVTALVARGDEVTCLVRSPKKAALRAWTGVRLVRGDLDDAVALREGCAGADVIYHLAGRIAARDLDEFMRENRDGTARVLEAAAAQPPQRFVLVSSIAAAGPTTPGAPIDEDRPPRPVTPYGKSKLAGEQLLRNISFPFTIVRPPVVYGEWDEALLRLFKLARHGIVPLFGDGSQELSVIYGADVADALIAAATSDRTAGRIYFATHPAITTARRLAQAVGYAVGRTLRFIPLPAPVARAAMWTIGSLARLVGQSSVVSSERAAEFLAPAWTCRADALRADSGWQARIDLETGLGRTAAWYRREGWLS